MSAVEYAVARASWKAALNPSRENLLIEPLEARVFLSATATFIRSDGNTEGNWGAVYGADGYDLFGGPASLPSYAQVSAPTMPGTSAGATGTWTTNTSDLRALEDAPWYSTPTTDRTAGYTTSSTTGVGANFSLDVNLTDGNTHEIALYLLDWDGQGRGETVQVFDTGSGTLLDTESVSSFSSGEYLVWNLSGNVTLTVTGTAGLNPVASGLFFAPAATAPTGPATASFLASDTTTQGNWSGVYGSQGYDLLDSSSDVPDYAQVSALGEEGYVWDQDATSSSAPQNPSAGGRTAACYFSGTSFGLDLNLNFTDGESHQIALYLLDYDNQGRSETVRLSDAYTGTVLDTESVSDFSNGTYLLWDVSGDVRVTISNNTTLNAVASGVFFDAPADADGVPINLQNTGTTATSVSLEWDPVAGASSYTILRQGNQSSTGYTTFTTSANTFTDSTVAGDTEYTYQVESVSDGITSLPSSSVWAQTLSNSAEGSQTLWPSDQVPSASDDSYSPQATGGLEVGVQFTSSVDGYVTGIQFYKGLQNTGTHIGDLWDSSGDLLASAVFTDESQSGWQQVDFTPAIPITAGQTYTASYFGTSGHFAYTLEYFESSGTESGSLQAPAGSNGVFEFGPSAFPTQVYDATNYWVQPVFLAQSNAVTPEPLVESLASVNAEDDYTLNLSPGGGTDPISSWEINWGDGTDLQEVDGDATSVDHTYAAAGTYPISVTASNSTSTYQVPTNINAAFNNGTVTTDFGANDSASAAVVQPDGELVVAGTSGNSFAVARYNTDGTPDGGFGSNGQVITAVDDGGAAAAVTLDSSGNVLVAGTVWDDSLNEGVFAVVRYTPDGSLDTTFGNGGIVLTPFGASANATGIAVQSSGRIVVAGYSQGQVELAGYNTDGTLDSNFGSNGIATVTDDPIYSVSGLALQQDDSLVVLASAPNGPQLIRYAPDGSLDGTFGNQGIAALPSTLMASSLAIDYSGTAQNNADWGSIVVAGTGLVRCNTDGSLDYGFGSQWVAPAFAATSVAVLPAGQIIVAGSANGQFGAAAYNPDGSVQSSFGVNGQLSIPIDSSAAATAVVPMSDGSIALVGYAWNGTDNDFAVASVLPSNTVQVSIPVPTVSANVMSDQEIDLSWGTVFSGASGVEVLESTDGTTYTPIASLDSSASGYPVTGLSDTTSYDFELLIETDQCTIPLLPSAYTDPVSASTAPPVTDLSATAVSSSEIDLSWDNNDPNSQAFEIDESTDGLTWQAAATTSNATTLSYRDIGLPVAMPIYYRVRAILPSGPSNPSATVVASTPILNPASPPPAPTTYWVSPGGSGTQYSQSAPGSLLSVVKYLDNAPAGQTSIVYLESGNYFVGQTLKIDGNASNVTFEQAPGSTTQPVISGGLSIPLVLKNNQQVSPWNYAYTVPAGGGNAAFQVWSASLATVPFPIPDETQFRQIYLGQQRIPIARTPAAGANYNYIDDFEVLNPGTADQTLAIDIPKADAPDDGSMSFSAFVSQQYTNDSTNAVEIAFLASYNETILRIARVQSDPLNSADYQLIIAAQDGNDFIPTSAEGDEMYTNGKPPFNFDGDEIYQVSQQPFFLENAPQFLQPGTFYEDTSAQTVYYAVRNSNDVSLLETNDVTIPVAISDGTNATYPISGYSVYSSPLVEIGSDSGDEVQNVTINGIALEYSSWIDPSYYGYMADQDGYFTLDSTEWDEETMQIPALQIENATGVAITDDAFAHLGGAGLEIYNRSVENTISDNTFNDISGNGIIVDGDPGDASNANGQTIPYGTGLGYDPTAVSERDTISDNTISTIGAEFPDSCAILASYTDNLTITVNTIYDIPEMGITLGVVHGTSVTTPPHLFSDSTSYRLADVEWNNIYDFGEMLQDGGCIYVDGPNWDALIDKGTLVENNYIHDNPLSQQDGSPLRAESYGVYLESNSNGVTATENDLFDIRAGSGLAAEVDNGAPRSTVANAKHNIETPPIDSSTIIFGAGANPTSDLSLSLSAGSSPATYTLNFPYAGSYRVAIRVEDVRGAASAFSIVIPAWGDELVYSLAAQVNAASFLLPVGWGVSAPDSESAEIAFDGRRNSSLILEAVWLVPETVNPYVS